MRRGRLGREGAIMKEFNQGSWDNSCRGSGCSATCTG